ncbi:hypothetical protein TNIN_308211 [Trichonephila inaurata madagascariensis]|uniref:Uncharacterized protein n=1 Tax=Trichonephila inaurata madagascariensis TaxID=2747483 RepID=A0A8X6WRX0_9ARAC|nr:hypothetical protein TNIN_308211 [Trichonephila inaurata madagascariensis]
MRPVRSRRRFLQSKNFPVHPFLPCWKQSVSVIFKPPQWAPREKAKQVGQGWYQMSSHPSCHNVGVFDTLNCCLALELIIYTRGPYFFVPLVRPDNMNPKFKIERFLGKNSSLTLTGL